MVYIILGTGFEETEAIAPCDILRRGGVDVKFVGIGSLDITGGHGIIVRADCLIENVDLADAEMIVVPGGMGGVESIESCPGALAILKEAKEKKIRLGAICAGPRVLAGLGILDGTCAVCYPGLEGQMAGGKMDLKKAALTDGLITTGRGPGAAIDFGLEILGVLRGKDTAENVAKGLVYIMK